MKVSLFYKIMFCFFIHGSVFLASCVDKSIDLGNLSNEMLIGGKIPLPVLDSSRLSIEELLREYRPNDNNLHGVIIDTDDNNDIYLAYDTLFTYDLTLINTNFDSFASGMLKVGIDEMLSPNIRDLLKFSGKDEIKLSSDLSLEPLKVIRPYDMDTQLGNEMQGSIPKQKLTKIEFRNTDIIITTHTSIDLKTDNMLQIRLEMSGIDPIQVAVKKGEQATRISYDRFTVEAVDTIKVTFTMQGDDKTIVKIDDTISCGVEFESRDKNPNYIAYGYFNYRFEDAEEYKIDTLVADIYSYLPKGTQLSLLDPKFNFIVSSNIGVPFYFRLKKMTSHLYNEDGKIETKELAPDSAFYIARSLLPGKSVEQQFDVNDDLFTKDGGDGFSAFINTQLSSLNFFYSFDTELVELADNPDLPEEFIPSDGKIEIQGTLRVPMAFGEESKIYYQDTIKLDFNTESLEYVDSLELRLTYENHLPIGFYLDLSLLDENNQNILGEGVVYQSIVMPKSKTNDEGIVIEDPNTISKGVWPLVFKKDTKTSILEMEKAKYLVLNYESIRVGDERTPIRLKTTDYILVKLGAIIDGKITLNIK
jgi:hypothetical protein